MEFSDFQCPFCSKVEPTIKRLMTEYAGKVRLVFRRGLARCRLHERAEKAAEASHCAEAQEKYWPMHDARCSPTKSDKLDVDDLKEKMAGERSRYGPSQLLDKCLDSGQMADEVASSPTRKRAKRWESRAHLHFFVNGHSLDGAQPYEEFKTSIDRELARSAPAKKE